MVEDQVESMFGSFIDGHGQTEYCSSQVIPSIQER